MKLKECLEMIYVACTNYDKDITGKLGTEREYEGSYEQAYDTVLEELNNRISKDELKNILRRVQDYQLNYKDTVLFNIIMQEIFGETKWTNLEDKEQIL